MSDIEFLTIKNCECGISVCYHPPDRQTEPFFKSYHPSPYGQTESLNTTFAAAISYYINRNHSVWCLFIPHKPTAYCTVLLGTVPHERCLPTR